MNKISGIYKITNTITGDFYIGSSKDVKHRWACHKCQSKWNECPNNPMYQDMKQYGVDSFVFEVLAEVEAGSLKEMEQHFIETLKPTYNNYNANGWNIERRKEYQQSKEYKESQKRYRQSEKGKESQKKRHQTKEYKEYQKEYQQSKKCKECRNRYYNQLCLYNGETLTLRALSLRFYKAGIIHPAQEAKKYIIKK